MKKLLLLGAMVGGLSLSGMTETAKADHCTSGGLVGRRSFSYGGVYAQPTYSYARPYYSSYGGYGYGYARPATRGFSYSSPRFSISVGSGYNGRSGLGYGSRGFGSRGFGSRGFGSRGFGSRGFGGRGIGGYGGHRHRH